MARYNLLDEKWIMVADNEGVKNISMKELFKNAHLYKGLAGDMKTQDFAVMRVMLAVLHTVFSRFNADGKPYEFFEVDEEKFLQTTEIEENRVDNYEEELYQTWIDIWRAGKFPDIVEKYLEKWRDRFYLYDDKFPFFQVTKEVIDKDAERTERFFGKNINRLISESNNKIAWFSPKSKDKKEYLTDCEVTRWLITFQGYSGAFHERVRSFGKEISASYGWLYTLGGIFLKGDNLFETLMLNFRIVNNNSHKIQKPCWEMDTIEKNIDLYFYKGIDNISSLYTAWSNEVLIDPSHDESKEFSCKIVMLPEIEKVNNFLEPMTLWGHAEEENKFIPNPHKQNQSMWRNFGLITGVELKRKSGIIEWINTLNDISDSHELGLDKVNITVCAIGMKAGGTATSKIPVDEIADVLNMRERVLVDTGENGWITRINDAITHTKQEIETTMKYFFLDLAIIRNINNKKEVYSNRFLEQFYTRIDLSFREWLGSVDINSEKDAKIKEWYKLLKGLMKDYIDEVISNSTARDYKGIVLENKKKKTIRNINIAIIYNSFISKLNKNL